MTPPVPQGCPALFGIWWGDVRFRMALAASPHTPGGWLEVLGQDPAHEVRLLVAGNPGTPESTLRGFGSELTLRLQLAGNPSTPLEVLEHLSRLGDQDVPDRLTQNPSTPGVLLRTLFGHLSHAGMHRLFLHPNCPQDLREHLLKLHPQWKHHPSTPSRSEVGVAPHEPGGPPGFCGCNSQERNTDHETQPLVAPVAPPRNPAQP